jgi:hypothetical protein
VADTTHWLRRLVSAYPVPAWDDDRIGGYLDAMSGAEDRHIHAAVDRLVRGGWRRDFPPAGPTLRLIVDEIARTEADERRRQADQAARREQDGRAAGPWHPLLWLTWHQLENGNPVSSELQPYADIIRRHNLTPEDAGVRENNGPNHGLWTDRDAITTSWRQAVTEAEQVWRNTGDQASAGRAARAAIDGITTPNRM